jgi:hypothetical protein
VNWYIHTSNRRTAWTMAFSAIITIPSILLGFVAASLYVNRVMVSLPWLPLIPFEAVPPILAACAITFAVGTMASKLILKPKGSSSRKGGAKSK